MSAELLVLVDNVASCDGLCGEHGLSILIQGEGRQMLFDTGPRGETLQHNSDRLGVALTDIEAVILSHGHCDHTGGLGLLAAGRPKLIVYAHPGAFSRRWAERRGRPMKDVSCPHAIGRLVEAGAVFQAVRAPEMLTDWLVLSGPVGGPNAGGESFVIRKADDLVVDSFEDELFCLIRGDRGWTVLTGCCHRGLKNTLRAAKFLAHDEPLAAIVGGLHLRSAAKPELDDAAELLESYGRPDLYVCHCTGDDATGHLQKRFGRKVQPIGAGARVRL